MKVKKTQDSLESTFGPVVLPPGHIAHRKPRVAFKVAALVAAILALALNATATGHMGRGFDAATNRDHMEYASDCLARGAGAGHMDIALGASLGHMDV